MHLLQRIGDNAFTLASDLTDEYTMSPYAILSHTWGPDTEEVTFQDLVNGVGQAKPGYEKIRFCGEQAWKDGLRYFWIDTGCIDKTNKAELSYSIRSMFRWYQNAARCYVYLPDVSAFQARSNEELNSDHENIITSHEEPWKLSWKLNFRESRWFTRGWTLQESLGPNSVNFLSRNITRIKRDHKEDSRSTRSQVFQSELYKAHPLPLFNVEVRLS
jgi:hypothetical protein